MADANCNRNCWIAGAGLGLLVWIFSAGIGSAGWLGGLFLGIIAGVLLALLLIWGSLTASLKNMRFLLSN